MDGTRANKNTSMPYEKRMPVLELEEKASCMQFWSAEIKATMTRHFSTGGKSAPTFEDPCFEEQATSSTSRCELMLPGLAWPGFVAGPCASRTGPLATERHLHTKRHGATPCALRQPAPYGPLRPGCAAATSRGQTVGPRRASIAGQARRGTTADGRFAHHRAALAPPARQSRRAVFEMHPTLRGPCTQ